MPVVPPGPRRARNHARAFRPQGSAGLSSLSVLEAHPHAELAAEAAEAAGAQGKFWPMHDLLFEQQQHLDEQHLLGCAAKVAWTCHVTATR